MTSKDTSALVDQADDFAARTIRHAAHRAPHPLNARLAEEWLADLAGRRGHWQRIGLALGCLWATRVITADHVALGSTPAVVATHNNTAALSAGSSVFSRRSIVLAMIVSIHALLLYGFISGLPAQVIHAIQPTDAYYIDPPTIQRPIIDPHVLLTGIARTKIDALKTPYIGIIQTPDQPSHPLIDTDGTGGTTTVALPSPVRHVGGPGPRFPATEDFYPPASRRADEQGTSIVRVCVDVTGRLTDEPKIAQSSGIARLDEGALRLARAGSGYYRSTIENGQRVADCYPFRVHFLLSP